VVGVLNASEKQGDEPFTDMDLLLSSILAGQAAGSILVSTSLRELEEKNQQLRAEIKSGTRELRIANHQLAELKQFNESIVNSVPHGLVAFDRAFKVLFANPAARELMELPQGEGAVAPVCDWATEDQDKAWQDEVTEVLNTASPVEIERVTLACASGQPVTVSAHIAPLRDSEGRIFGGLLILEDLQGRIEVEERLKNTERLAVLGRLAAKVAHELNTPLDGVKRFVQLARRVNGSNTDLERYLADATTGLDRMSEIISSLLRFSRSAHRRFGHVRINTLLREAISTTDHLRAEKNIRLQAELDESLPSTNYRNLGSVFVNLVKNAYDALGGDGALLIRSGCSDGKIQVSFSDNGCGIPKAFEPRIFDPFFTTKEMGKGTGLGLAICKDIVESYDGELTVESEEGKGTTFTVRLPMPETLARRATPAAMIEETAKDQD